MRRKKDLAASYAHLLAPSVPAITFRRHLLKGREQPVAVRQNAMICSSVNRHFFTHVLSFTFSTTTYRPGPGCASQPTLEHGFRRATARGRKMDWCARLARLICYRGCITGFHESLCQEKSTSFLGALRRARIPSYGVTRVRTCASRLVVPAPSRTGHPFAASSPEELSQKIEFGFSASPETIRREPLKLPSSPSRLPAGPGSLRIE